MAKTAKKTQATPENVITETELRVIQMDRHSVAELKKQLKALETKLDAKEEDVIQRLENGAKVMGDVSAIITSKARRNVQWMSLFKGLAERFGLNGDVEAEKARMEWPETTYKCLEIG